VVEINAVADDGELRKILEGFDGWVFPFL